MLCYWPGCKCVTGDIHAQGLIFNEMRGKTKVIQEPLGLNPKDYPDWSFDGSSTGQAEGNNSDCILKYGFTFLSRHRHHLCHSHSWFAQQSTDKVLTSASCVVVLCSSVVIVHDCQSHTHTMCMVI